MGLFFPKRFLEQKKAQSAMEYLMTHGWAILIIMIVLVALIGIGVFNSSSSTPRVIGGSCQIERTIQGASLEGLCNDGWPQFVAEFDDANIVMSKEIIPSTISSFSESVWIEFSSIPTGSSQYASISGESTSNKCTHGSNGGVYCLFYNNGNLKFGHSSGGGSHCAYIAYAWTPSTNTWYFITVTYVSGGTSYIYVDGQEVAAGTISLCNDATLPPFEIGDEGGFNYFPGDIANVQLYNTSLDASTVRSLYLEGIGADPIIPLYTIGWWPLNGNSDDYSGNNNEGQISGDMSYISSWNTYYTQP